MRTRMYGGVRGRKTKVGRKLSFSSYSIMICDGLYVEEEVHDVTILNYVLLTLDAEFAGSSAGSL